MRTGTAKRTSSPATSSTWAWVGNYGHLKYRLVFLAPIPADRAVRVDIQKI